jgi:hypothetical protein
VITGLCEVTLRARDLDDFFERQTVAALAG